MIVQGTLKKIILKCDQLFFSLGTFANYSPKLPMLGIWELTEEIFTAYRNTKAEESEKILCPGMRLHPGGIVEGNVIPKMVAYLLRLLLIFFSSFFITKYNA